MPDRKMKVTRRSLRDRSADDDSYRGMSPGDRVALVWELTKTAWSFTGKPMREPGFSRHHMRVSKTRG